MSIFSDHDCGALSDEDFERECARMNNKDRAERDTLEEFINNDLKQLQLIPHGRGNMKVVALSTIHCDDWTRQSCEVEQEEPHLFENEDSEGGLIDDE